MFKFQYTFVEFFKKEFNLGNIYNSLFKYIEDYNIISFSWCLESWYDSHKELLLPAPPVNYDSSLITSIKLILNQGKTSNHLDYEDILSRLECNKLGYLNPSESTDFNEILSTVARDSISGTNILYDIWCYLDLDKKNFSLSEANDVLVWVNDLIMLVMIRDLRNYVKDLDQTCDEVLLLRNDEKDLLRRLSPSVRKAMSTTRISLTQRIYSGFDTEYVNIEYGVNKLLSYQLALEARVGIFVSRPEGFNIDYNILAEGSEVKTSFTESFKTKVSNLTRLLEELTLDLKVNNHKNLIEKLDNFTAKGLLHRNRSQKGVFYTILNSVNPQTKFLTHFEVVKELSMQTLTEKIYELGTPLLQEKRTELCNLIEIDPLSSLIPATGSINLVLLAHYSVADLTMLSDFDKFKTHFDLLGKTFISLMGAYKVKVAKGVYITITLRDTAVISAPGTSLEKLGSLYGLNKIKLANHYKSSMDKLLYENPTLFEEYAVRDAVISLIHGLTTEYFNAVVVDGRVHVPPTVASMGKAFVLKYWLDHNIVNPNERSGFKLGDWQSLFTPKGIQMTDDFASMVPQYVGGFRGGRNESFAYGYDEDLMWFDYDLTSAYTSLMSIMGTPDYSRAFRFNTWNSPSTLAKFKRDFMDNKFVFNCFSVFKVEFEFPVDRLYPNLPVHLSKDLTIYPSQGISCCTGLELKVAIDNGCVIKSLINGCVIPFDNCPQFEFIEQASQSNGLLSEMLFMQTRKAHSTSRVIRQSPTKGRIRVGKNQRLNIKRQRVEVLGVDQKVDSTKKEIKNTGFLSDFQELLDTPSLEALISSKDYEKTPFFGIINFLQEQRRKYPKTNMMNTFFKLLGNSIYGQTATGLNAKPRFNSRLNTMQPSVSGGLTNPVICCWTTGAIRATLSETMNLVERRGGKIISCTTDGFITNLPGLDKDPTLLSPMIAYFRHARKMLSGDDSLLELKTSSKGVATWCVRGQLGLGKTITNQETTMKAMTGFQSRSYKMSELQTLIKDTLTQKPGEQKVPFISMSLSSGKDAYIYGDKVTPRFEERMFRLFFDNRRMIQTNTVETFEPRTVTKVVDNVLVTTIEKPLYTNLCFTKPWTNVETCKAHIQILKTSINKYAFETDYPILETRFKDYKDMLLRLFTRLYLSGEIELREEIVKNNIDKEHFIRTLSQLLRSKCGVRLNLSKLAREFNKPTFVNCVPGTIEVKDLLFKLYKISNSKVWSLFKV